MKPITIFDHLTERELCYLSYLAYMIIPIEEDKLGRNFMKMFGWKLAETDALTSSLRSKDYIRLARVEYWGPVCARINDNLVLPLLCKLHQEHPDWLHIFQKSIAPRAKKVPARELMLSLANALVVGRKLTLDDHPYLDHISSIYNYIGEWFYNGTFVESLQFFPDAILLQFLPYAVDSKIQNDYGSGTEELIAIQQSITKRSDLHTTLRHKLALANFLERGEVAHCYVEEFELLFNSVWQFQAIQAIQLMLEGHYDAASKRFESALDVLSFRQQWFSYPILNFLYVLSLAKSNGVIAANKLGAIARADYGSDYETFAAMVVAKMMRSEDVETPNAAIAKGFEKAPQRGWVLQKLSLMLCQWLGLNPMRIGVQNAKQLSNPEEIQYNAWATQFASQQLSSLTYKPMWERAIDLIMREEHKRELGLQAQPSDERSERLAYFLVGHRLEIREQKRLKSGRWGAGHQVSDANFLYGHIGYDELDKRIKELYASRRYKAPDYREVLPLLAGSDKLFVGECAPYQQCTVREEKPFLTATIGKNHITLASNVPTIELTDREESHVLYNLTNEGELCFFKVPLRVRSYLLALLRIGKFPLEAEPQLKALFDKISGLIEIHSEMIEGGSTLPSVDGDSNIVIQASSERGGYRVAAVVRPLAEGRLTMVPGVGDQHIFDQKLDGTRFQVVRNKKAEKNNVAPLLEVLEQNGCDESGPCVWHLDAYQLLELMEWLPEQAATLSMEWPEGDKIKLTTVNPSSWNISLHSHGGWFDVEGEIPIDQETILSVGQLLELLGEGRGRFIKLKEGQYLGLTDSLRRQLSRIDAVAQTVRGKARITSLAAGLIGDALSGELDIAHPKEIDDLRQRIRQSQDLEAEIPAALNATLRDYQEVGFRWIDRLASWGAGACLADDMGLGKTIQTIAFLLHKQAEGPSLVVAPASVVPNWRKELARFAPTLNVVVLNELPSSDRQSAIAQTEAGCVLLTTYGLLISEETAVVSKSWNVICLDEAHSIKNASTKTSAVCMKLEAQHRLILTGTPIQNHLGELWNLFQFINPGLLGSFEQFSRKYIRPIEEAHDKVRQQQLKRIIQPFMLRRTKQEVVAELPDKQEITLPVSLSTEELAIYENLRMEAKQQLEQDSADGSLSVNALSMITKLRMAACSASLASKGWTGTSSKLDAFCDLANEICTAGNRVLVFSQFTTFLQMAKTELERRGMHDYLYLDGSTPIKQRSEMVDAFQHGKCPLFIISLKAGGLGLNLTGANYVIHLDPWWNPAIEQQATDRAYRIGQEQKVTVYHLISEHTIEEKIVRLHQTKRDLADSLLEGSDMSHKLSAADLLDMLQEQ